MKTQFGPFVVTNSTDPSLYKRKNGDVILVDVNSLSEYFGSSLPKESDEVPQLEYELEFRSVSHPVVRVWISTLEIKELSSAYLDISCDFIDSQSAYDALEQISKYLRQMFPPVFEVKPEAGTFFLGGKL